VLQLPLGQVIFLFPAIIEEEIRNEKHQFAFYLWGNVIVDFASRSLFVDEQGVFGHLPATPNLLFLIAVSLKL